ncbi:hypothetical protein [Pleionea sp. CnH1-48]|uniref:hypothetical protein n=1 Tax=Pleionea sp. CnH1-48 TaxID=2954494 RepID=UPI0020979FFA|nr:hypothetical protein [Pleionea sp. CnH1-48]MCO7223741.1 hypothetical protein [Pleionea sp. CnH1-48]
MATLLEAKECVVVDGKNAAFVYKETVGSKVYELNYIRSADRVILWRKNEPVIEVISHLNNKVELIRLFPEHNRGIRYQAKDLAAINKSHQWDKYFHLVDVDSVKQFSKSSTVCPNESHLKGSVNDVNYEIRWLDQAQLPSSLLIHSNQNTYQINWLRELSPEEQKYPFKVMLLSDVVSVDEVSRASSDATIQEMAKIGDGESIYLFQK